MGTPADVASETLSTDSGTVLVTLQWTARDLQAELRLNVSETCLDLSDLGGERWDGCT